MAEDDTFADVLAANEGYGRTFSLGGVPALARRGLAVVTCIDSRIEPLAMLGLEPGDAKILRNAGARVTDDVLRSLIIATNLLGVDRVCIVGHTDCAMTKKTEEELGAAIADQRGGDVSGWTWETVADQEAVLAADIA